MLVAPARLELPLDIMLEILKNIVSKSNTEPTVLFEFDLLAFILSNH
jgi:hypothetical protein